MEVSRIPLPSHYNHLPAGATDDSARAELIGPEVVLATLVSESQSSEQPLNLLHPNSNVLTDIGKATLECIEALAGVEIREDQITAINSSLSLVLADKKAKKEITAFIGNLNRDEREIASSGLRNFRKATTESCVPAISGAPIAPSPSKRKRKAERATRKSMLDVFIESLDSVDDEDLTDSEKLSELFNGTFRDFPKFVDAFSKALDAKGIAGSRKGDAAFDGVLGTLHSIYDTESLVAVNASKKNGTESKLYLSEIKKWLDFTPDESTDLSSSFRILVVGDLLQKRGAKPTELNKLLANFANNSDDTIMMLVITKSLFSGNGVYASAKNALDYMGSRHKVKKLPRTSGKMKKLVAPIEEHVKSVESLLSAIAQASCLENPTKAQEEVENQIVDILSKASKNLLDFLNQQISSKRLLSMVEQTPLRRYLPS